MREEDREDTGLLAVLVVLVLVLAAVAVGLACGVQQLMDLVTYLLD